MDYKIKDNLAFIRTKIENSAASSKRAPDSVKLLAVSKNFTAENIMEAYNTGQRMFGENRIQELESKAPNLPKDIQWHLIGHLQSNKAAKAVELAEYIHSVDSEKLLERINRLAQEKNKKQKVLLEVNISEEESKFGLNLNNLSSCVKTALSLENIELVGFMTMAPFGAPENELDNIFSAMRSKRDQLEQEFNAEFPELSMGMSDDFEAAVINGSTIVRIGTAIFGKRSY